MSANDIFNELPSLARLALGAYWRTAEYAVRTAVDGADALAQIGERPPDLVLTDVMMPNVDGFELLAKLRESPRTRRLPSERFADLAGTLLGQASRFHDSGTFRGIEGREPVLRLGNGLGGGSEAEPG